MASALVTNGLCSFFAQQWVELDEDGQVILDEEDKPVPLTPIEWPNTTLLEGEKTGPWVRVAILPASNTRALITGSRQSGAKETGIFSLQIFVKSGTGTEDQTALIDRAEGILREIRVDTQPGKPRVVLAMPEHFVLGDQGLVWYQTNVNCPYEFLES